MHDLVVYPLNAVITAIHRASPLAINERQEASLCITRLAGGDASVLPALLGLMLHASSADRLSELREAIRTLGPTLQALCQRVTEESLTTAAKSLARTAKAVEDLDLPDVAYNIYESSYMVGAFCGVPALNVATKLRALSDPGRQDQVRVNIWREAIEQFRESLAKANDWSKTIGKLELALSLPIAHPIQQKQLVDQLMEVAKAAKMPEGAELGMLVTLQAPRACVDANLRRRVGELVASARRGPPPSPNVSADTTAAITAQTRVDDLRIRLAGVPDVRASLSWRDLTLTHRNLIAAVPLGRSLTADVARTGHFAMQLVHEFGHAYCLMGPIGWAFAALLAANSVLEGIAESSLDDDGRIKLRERQLSLALRSAKLLAVWRTWLEGVSLYLELLCDPAESPGEILAPFAALRSLIDVDVQNATDESADEWAIRYSRRLTEEFEGFYGAALGQYSRRHHVDALALRVNPDTKPYLSGYLTVRSLAARWQRTVGRPITHVQVTRLLLDATRNGLFEVMPPLSAHIELFEQIAVDRYGAWLQHLSDLDAASLNLVLSEVEFGDAAKPLHWPNGRPQHIDSLDRAAQAVQTAIDGYIDEASAIALGEYPPEGSEAANRWRSARAVIASQAYEQRALSSLVPVGEDRARVLLIAEESMMALCPRTYSGLAAPGQQGDDPRYSPRIARIGEPDFAAYRDAFVRIDAARAKITVSSIWQGTRIHRQVIPVPRIFVSIAMTWRMCSCVGMHPGRLNGNPASSASCCERVGSLSQFPQTAVTWASFRSI